MTQKPETKFTKRVCKELELCGALVIPYVGSHMGHNGTPDRCIWHKLWQGWLEFKGQKTKVTRLQSYMIRRMNEICPGSAFIVRQLNEDSMAILDHDENEIAIATSGQELLSALARVANGK